MSKKTRSLKLRKYEFAYESCLKKQKTVEKKKSPRPQRRVTENKKTPVNNTVEKSKKRQLNDYQKFVRSESKKDIYKNMSGKERLQSISKKWKTK